VPAAAEGGAIVYPRSDERLRQRATRSPARHFSFGDTEEDAVQVTQIKPAGQASIVNVRFGHGGERCVGVPLIGRHNAWNAAAAAAAAFALGLSPDTIAQGLSYARPPKRRSEVKQVAGRRVIDDCYNANPASMAAALDTLVEVRRGASANAGAVAVLGDMLELGPDEESFHVEVGQHAARTGLAGLIAFGTLARATARAAREAGLSTVHETSSPEEAAALVLSLTAPGDWVLLKASRGTALERVLEEMKRQSSEKPATPGAPATPATGAGAVVEGGR
jgi:UDP-N-acetylmuramyl pentapeptide synthase